MVDGGAIHRLLKVALGIGVPQKSQNICSEKRRTCPAKTMNPNLGVCINGGTPTWMVYQVVPGTRRGGSFEKGTWLIGIHGALERSALK